MNGALQTVTDFIRQEPGIRSEARAYQMIRAGLLPVVRLGRRLYIDPEQWAEFRRNGGKGLAGGWRREAPGA